MSKVSIKTASRFQNLFSGLSRAYGRYDLTDSVPVDAGGKVEGKAHTIKSEILPEHYQKHLVGKSYADAIGVIPICEDNTVSFASIDIDDYSIPVDKVLSFVHSTGFPLNPTRSKSGGVHLHAFLARPIPASMIRKKLKVFCGMLAEEIVKGIDDPEEVKRIRLKYGNAEIFPKQNNLDADGIGNWINLPWFDHENTERFGWNVETHEEIRSLEEWLTYAESRKINMKHLGSLGASDDLIASEFNGPAPLPDGPPCLNKLLRGRPVDGDGRNTIVFNLATYFYKKLCAEEVAKGNEEPKISDMDVKNQVITAVANHFGEPLTNKEIEDTVRKSLHRDKIHYQCQNDLLASVCDRSACSMQRYGVPDARNLFEELFHLIPVTDQGDLLWEESGYKLQFTVGDVDHYFYLKPENLLKYESVKNAALYRGILIPHMDAEDWREIISAKLESKTDVRLPEEMSTIGTLRGHITKFLDMYANAKDKSHITTTKVFHDETRKQYWMLPSALPAYLDDKRFRYDKIKLMDILRKHFGMITKSRSLGREQDSGPVRLWIFPDNLQAYDPENPDADSDDDDDAVSK